MVPVSVPNYTVVHNHESNTQATTNPTVWECIKFNRPKEYDGRGHKYKINYGSTPSLNRDQGASWKAGAESGSFTVIGIISEPWWWPFFWLTWMSHAWVNMPCWLQVAEPFPASYQDSCFGKYTALSGYNASAEKFRLSWRYQSKSCSYFMYIKKSTYLNFSCVPGFWKPVYKVCHRELTGEAIQQTGISLAAWPVQNLNHLEKPSPMVSEITKAWLSRRSMQPQCWAGCKKTKASLFAVLEMAHLDLTGSCTKRQDWGWKH